jgi:hypothetical protein
MKILFGFLLIILGFGCQHKEDDRPQKYLTIYEALRHDSCYRDFVGYQIIPRDENYYVVLLNKPKLTIYVIYQESNEIDVGKEGVAEISDSLFKYYPKSVEHEARKLIDQIAKLISIMKKNSIQRAVCWPLQYPVKSNYFIEFGISQDEALVFDANQRYTDSSNQSVVTQLDSSWYYIKRNLPI